MGQGTCADTVYAETGLAVTLRDSEGNEVATGEIGSIPPGEKRLHLGDGDILTLHKEDRPGEDPIPASAPGGARPGHIGCGAPEVVDALQIGERVFISDGKVTGEVVAKRADEVDVLITRAGIGGARVKGKKGLNLPDTNLGLFGLTEKDREDLKFVAEHADGVNVSFIQHPDDVEDLLDELDAIGARDLGIVLKIETRGAVSHLPAILLAAMEWPAAGVMIARGDLAIEVGWLQLAEVIEEILMLCEAAHLPSIWATEVLDRFAKKGVPARGEVSDVVMAGRAECIMLNKGPYISLAIRGLDQVLASLEAYREKRAARLPALRLELPDPAEVGRDIGDRQGRWRD
jgi:pyruvate kinase